MSKANGANEMSSPKDKQSSDSVMPPKVWIREPHLLSEHDVAMAWKANPHWLDDTTVYVPEALLAAARAEGARALMNHLEDFGNLGEADIERGWGRVHEMDSAAKAKQAREGEK